MWRRFGQTDGAAGVVAGMAETDIDGCLSLGFGADIGDVRVMFRLELQCAGR